MSACAMVHYCTATHAPSYPPRSSPEDERRQGPGLTKPLSTRFALSICTHPSSANTSAGLKYVAGSGLEGDLRNSSEQRIWLFCSLESMGVFSDTKFRLKDTKFRLKDTKFRTKDTKFRPLQSYALLGKQKK